MSSQPSQGDVVTTSWTHDILTTALGNPEHPGRTRGIGSEVPWGVYFRETKEEYERRMRARRSQTQSQTTQMDGAAMEERIRAEVSRQVEQIKEELRAQFALAAAASSPGARRSYCASGTLVGDDGGSQGLPVDRITVTTLNLFVVACSIVL